MKVAIGAMLCEGNSLTHVMTHFEDFDYAKGEAMLDKVAVGDMLKARDCEIVPTIYAHALPGGAVIKADFLKLCGEIIDKLTDDLDGIWLYLHGAMCVEEIGSAEEYLLREVRRKVGYTVPISVAMDFHADNSDAIPELCNCVTGYRTAPHCDREDTERRAMSLLFECIDRGILPTPQMARANVIICGDAVQTALEPMKGIMDMAAEMEKLPGMMDVSVFNGQPWIDEPYNGPNIIVTHESDNELALECAEKIARKFYDVRHDFKFLIEAVEPEEAIRLAMDATEDNVFISDSGDNTTAGAAGDNAYMLNRLMASGAKNVLLAGIMDADACDKCYGADIGDILTLKVGGSLATDSESAQVTGKLVHRGDILSYNYSISVRGTQVFTYFEYTGEDYDADMEKMAASPVMQKWWTYSKPCFLHHDKGEYYEPLTEVFYTK